LKFNELSDAEESIHLARDTTAEESRDRSSESQLDDLSSVTSYHSESGIPTESPMGTNGSPVVEVAADMDKEAIIRQLMEELNETKERSRQYEERSKQLLDMMSCVSSSANRNESKMKNEIEKLKSKNDGLMSQNEALQDDLYALERLQEELKYNNEIVGHGSFLSEAGGTGTSKPIEISPVTAVAGSRSLSPARSMSGSVVTQPTMEHGDTEPAGLISVRSRDEEEEEMDFTTAFDESEDFEVVYDREERRHNQTETGRNKRETTAKRRTESQQTQTEVEQLEEEEDRMREFSELIQQQKEMIRVKDLEICEKTKMLDNMRTLMSSIKAGRPMSDQSELTEEIRLLQIQVFEHEESYRKEHNDRVMLHHRFKQLKRDCRVYKMEGDEARRQAEQATAELSRANEDVMDLREQLQRRQFAHNGEFSSFSSASRRAVFSQLSTTNNRTNTNSRTNTQHPFHNYDSQTRQSNTSTKVNSAAHRGYVTTGRGATSSKNDLHSKPGDRSTTSRRISISSEKVAASTQMKGDFTKNESNPSSTHITALQEDSPDQVHVNRASDSEPSLDLRPEIENNLSTSLTRSVCYQRCGAVTQSTTALSADSPSAVRYLQCDHGSCQCQTHQHSEDKKVRMSSSLSTSQELFNQDVYQQIDMAAD